MLSRAETLEGKGRDAETPRFVNCAKESGQGEGKSAGG